MSELKQSDNTQDDLKALIIEFKQLKRGYDELKTEIKQNKNTTYIYNSNSWSDYIFGNDLTGIFVRIISIFAICDIALHITRYYFKILENK